jgi:phosphate acyltransferase
VNWAFWSPEKLRFRVKPVKAQFLARENSRRKVGGQDKLAVVKIVIDAMGGDNAPDEIVAGTVNAARSAKDVQLCLVGDEQRIKAVLARLPHKPKLEIRHAEEFIRMDEHPGPNLRSRKNASMMVAARMVKDGEAQAFVCAGNTGALHQIALVEVGRLNGIRRPALAAVFPTRPTASLALDMGANSECKPEYLVQFAMMGSIYAAKVMGKNKPRIALLNIGKEEGKGNALVAATYDLLKQQKDLNFVGNVEPMSFFNGEVDVAVCDGFVGNMMLKTSEAVAEWLMHRVREAAHRTPAAKLGGHLLKPSLKALKQDINHSEHGGAVLLGLKGVVIKCHGRATADTIENGIKVAARALRNRVVQQIEESLKSHAPEGERGGTPPPLEQPV